MSLVSCQRGGSEVPRKKALIQRERSGDHREGTNRRHCESIAGSKTSGVPVGTKVTSTIEANSVEVPNLIGKTVGQAFSELGSLGFVYKYKFGPTNTKHVYVGHRVLAITRGWNPSRC